MSGQPFEWKPPLCTAETRELYPPCSTYPVRKIILVDGKPTIIYLFKISPSEMQPF